MSANLRAFLMLLRSCEGTADADGYRRIVGGGEFSSFKDHPRVIKSGTFRNGKAWTSSAAGAFQILSKTWDEAREALDLPDFSPASQDKAAIWLIARRGALPFVEAGAIEDAIFACNREWASLPGSPYGQPTKPMDECIRIFQAAGGFLAEGPAISNAETADDAEYPAVDLRSPDERAADHFPQPAGATPQASLPPPPAPAPAASLPSEPAMPAIAPLILAAGQMLYPVVSDLFKAHGSKTATRNAEIINKAAPALVEIAKQVTGQPTAEQAVQAVQADVRTREAFRAAVADDMDRIIGGIARLVDIDDASADRAAERAKGDDSINAATPVLIYGALAGVSTVFAAIVAMLVLQTLYLPDHRPMGELVALFITTCSTVVGFAVGIYLYRFGSSAGSKASGDALRAIAAEKK